MKPSEVIMERGWIQNKLENESGVCIAAAIHIACKGSVWGRPYDPRASELMSALQVSLQGSVVDWNNAPRRTKEQVIALLQEFETEFESEEIAQAEPVAIARV